VFCYNLETVRLALVGRSPLNIEGKNGTYTTGDLVAENDRYRLRACTNQDGRELLLQAAVESDRNSVISRNAWILEQLKTAAIDIEVEYEEAGGKGHLNYNLGFPELCDSLILESQGSRQVNIIGFCGVKAVETIIPLIKIWKDSFRVDLRTSAWIMGKLLKTISFAHDHRIQVMNLSGNNILIQPDQHYVLIFDWSSAVVHEESVPGSIRRQEIQAAAQCIIKALGNDLDRARVNDADLPYTNYLQLLASSGESDAIKAHQTFYELINSLCANPNSVWENGFYEFTTHRL